MILKASTSKGKRILAIYESLKGTSLSDLYSKPCQSTIDTYNRLHKEYLMDVNTARGEGWKVTKKAGSWSWSCGWTYDVNGVRHLKVHTRDNVWVVNLEQ